MEVGISTWTLPWAIGVDDYPQPKAPLDAVGLIGLAASLGVKVVQLADNLQLERSSQAELEEIALFAAESAITLELGTRGVEPRHLQRYLDMARQIGSRTVRTVLTGRLGSRDELLRAQGALRELLPDLERHQVTVALENNEAFTASEFAEIVGAVASPFVGICLDTANSLGVPETVETVVAELAEYTVMLHAKDCEIRRIDTRMGFTVGGAPIGDGCVDFHFVMGALRARGRDDISCIIEHWPPFDGDIESSVRREAEWLRRSLGFTRSLIALYEPVAHVQPQQR